jgi:hypothetical protein
MVIILVKNQNSRIDYTFRLVFDQVMGLEYEITSDQEEFVRSKLRKINYSKSEIPNSLHVLPSGLLDEVELINHNISVGEWKKLPIIFTNVNREIPFDIFAAVFYLVTRYEEYLPFDKDGHGRFEADQSIAFKNNFLQLPVVELWCQQFARNLGMLRHCKYLKPSNYTFTLTIDIDLAWLYKHRGFFRLIPGFLKNLASLNFGEIVYKLKILGNRTNDPGNSYEYLIQSQEKILNRLEFFILCSHRGRYDTNVSLHNRHLQKLIQFLDELNPVGLHPSYNSNNSFGRLEKEYRRLADVVGHTVTKSRQHYLLLNLPDTYRRLIKLGISRDYTMGYATRTGFRAGIARPFYFYDLYEEKQTHLVVVPFQVMDRTLQQYLNCTPSYASREMKYYTELIKSVGGNFCALWHNTSLGNMYEWKGWREVFDTMISYNLKK